MLKRFEGKQMWNQRQSERGGLWNHTKVTKKDLYMRLCGPRKKMYLFRIVNSTSQFHNTSASWTLPHSFISSFASNIIQNPDIHHAPIIDYPG